MLIHASLYVSVVHVTYYIISLCNIIYINRHAHIISDKHFTCILAVKPIALTLIYNR